MNFKNIVGISVLATLAACSGTGSCPPDSNGGALSLKIEAPAQYPAGLPESINAVLTMTNTSATDANNLKYTIPAPDEAGNYTGVTIVPNAGIGSNSESCINIKAGASCTFTATIGAYANPGSFTVTATPNSSKSSVRQALNNLLGTNSISVTTNLSLVDLPSIAKDTNFYILPDDQIIPNNVNAQTTAMISLLINNDGKNLASIKLVDESNNVMTFVAVGPVSYRAGYVNTYQVTIPVGVDIQKVKAIGFNNENEQICGQYSLKGLGRPANCSNTATINLAPSGAGILSVQPSYFNMSGDYESQVITLTNIGTGDVSNIVYPNISAPFNLIADSNSCGSSLAAGKSCNFKIGYTPSLSNGESILEIHYSNSVSQATQKSSVKINYVIKSNAELSLSTTSLLLNTVNTQQTVAITNIGNATATNLILPTLTAPVYLSSTTCNVGGSLAPQESCTYTVGYAGAESASSENVSFSYNGGSSLSTSLTIDWTSAKQYAYVVRNDFSNKGVYKCNLGTHGDISNCVQQVNSINIARGRDLTFNIVNGIKYLYVADYQVGGIFKCTLANNGDITGCSDITTSTPASGIEAGYITFGTVNNVQYAYFTDTNNHDLFSCTVKNDGDFDNCVSVRFSYIYGIHFASIMGTQYLYVNADINSSQGVLRFPLNSENGQLIENELQIILSYSDYNSGLDIYQFGGAQYLYTGYTGPVGSSWTLNSDGSSATNKIDFQNISNLPYSINFTTAIDMTPYGYVQSTGGIYKCDVNQINGALINCANTTAGIGVSVAFSLFESQCNPCGMFVTSSFSGGADLPAVANTLSLGAFTDGFAAGDAICQSNAATNSYTGTYKALIAGANRQPSGIDWVMYANKSYVRANDASVVIGTSTNGAQLPTTLTNAIDSSILTPALNGFAYNSEPWALDTVYGNCNNWTSATSGTWVYNGNPSSIAAFGPGGLPPLGMGYLSGSGLQIGCNSLTSVLYCVQQ